MVRYSVFIQKYGVWLLLSITLIIFLILHYLNPVLVWDENAYLANARSHITPPGTTHYTEDFRFPLIEYIISGVWFFTGESIIAARLVIVLFTLGLVYLFYLLMRDYFPRRTLFYTTLFALSPLILIWGYKVYTDVVAGFFATLSYYLLKKTIQLPNKHHNLLLVFLAGIVFGLGVLTKFPIALFGIAAGVVFLSKKEYLLLGSFTLGTFVTLAPWIIYNIATYGNPLWDFFAQYSIANYYGHVDPILFMVKNITMDVGLITALTVIGFFISLFLKKQRNILIEKYIMCVYVFLFFVYFYFITKIKHDRYHLLILPFMYILVYTGVAWIEKICKRFLPDKRKRIIVSWSIIILLIINTIIILSYHLNEELYRGKCQEQGAIQQTIQYLDEHKSPGETISSNVWVWFGYSNNLRAIALWTPDLDYLLRKDKPKYIMYHNQIGERYEENTLKNHPKLVLEKTMYGLCDDEKVDVYSVIN